MQIKDLIVFETNLNFSNSTRLWNCRAGSNWLRLGRTIGIISSITVKKEVVLLTCDPFCILETPIQHRNRLPLSNSSCIQVILSNELESSDKIILNLTDKYKQLRAVNVIKYYYKRAISDPHYTMCQRRLEREFKELHHDNSK